MRGIAPSPEQRLLKRWARALDDAGEADLATLKALSTDAHALRDKINAVLHVADGRLSQERMGAHEVPKPLHCDWVFRPALWSGPVRPYGRVGLASGTNLSGDASVFHDSPLSEVTFRQVRNDTLAPFGVRLDVLAFEGSFLSLVVDLPTEATRDLQKRHILRQTLTLETEAPLEAFSRLNIKHGPNTEQIVREIAPGEATVEIEFDLAYTDLDEQKVERIWVDLIFEGPEMNQILIRDMTFARRPRAEM
ncbi:MAG: DUF6478 family protein [Pseudomonadota bacterium]